LSLHKQHFVTAHSKFITAHFVFHCTLKNALHSFTNQQQQQLQLPATRLDSGEFTTFSKTSTGHRTRLLLTLFQRVLVAVGSSMAIWNKFTKIYSNLPGSF